MSREIEMFEDCQPRDAVSFWKVPSEAGLSIQAWHRILRVSRTIADGGTRHHRESASDQATGYRAVDRLLSRLREGQ